MEVWKEIEGLNGRYSVSNLGRIKCNGYYVCAGKNNIGKRLIRERILKPQNHPAGYKSYSFPKFKTTTIHRIVAKAFIDNPLNKEFVNHINGIKHDNRVENLEWVTRQENEDHAFNTGLKNRITSSVLNEEKVLYILDNCHEKSTKELSNKFNISPATVNRVIQRVIWSHVEYNKPLTPKQGYWKPVLDMYTGIYYESCNDAARAIGLNTQSLRLMLKGVWKNRTNMVFV